MTPHHKETNFINNQPVRFYKFVALAFLLITIVLFVVIIFMSSKRATISITTTAEPIEANKVFSIGMGGDYKSLIVTTTLKLTKTFSPTGSEEKLGLAIGTVTLHNDGSEDQSLIIKTRLLTPEGVLFRLKDKVLVPAKGTVEAEVYADVEGKGSNIGPVAHFIIPGLNADKQKIVYASSDKPMIGGIRTVGILTDQDVEKAESELLAILAEKAKMELQGKQSEKILVMNVLSQTVNKNNLKIGEAVDGFDLSGELTAVGTFYDDKDMQNFASEALKKYIVGDVELLSDKFSYNVNLEDMDMEKITGSLKLTVNGQARLNAESKQLDKTMFYGKNKDEIRRYLLSLDHIKGVDIKFSPVWMTTVPYVADHVSVVVTESE